MIRKPGAEEITKVDDRWFHTREQKPNPDKIEEIEAAKERERLEEARRRAEEARRRQGQP